MINEQITKLLEEVAPELSPEQQHKIASFVIDLVYNRELEQLKRRNS